MAVSPRTKTASFSIDRRVLEGLTVYCKKRGISRSSFMSKALEFYLRECLEDQEDYEAAAAAWVEFEKGNGKTYSAAEVRKELGL